MPIRKPKPTSPGRRFVTYPDFSEITKTEPEKTLVEGLKKSGGRNSNGRKTSRHRGGGAKRLYRKIDFKRIKDGIPAKVAAVEYDPNRTASVKSKPKRRGLTAGRSRSWKKAIVQVRPGDQIPIFAGLQGLEG